MKALTVWYVEPTYCVCNAEISGNHFPTKREAIKWFRENHSRYCEGQVYSSKVSIDRASICGMLNYTGGYEVERGRTTILKTED